MAAYNAVYREPLRLTGTVGIKASLRPSTSTSAASTSTPVASVFPTASRKTTYPKRP